MNREIEFRGKSYTEDKWLYGYLFKYTDNDNNDHYNILNNEETITVTIKDYGLSAIVPAFNPIKAKTIGQYTGLKDRTGKKIFAGDIVQKVFFNEKFDKEERRYEKYIVKYDEDRAGYVPFACGDGCGCCEFEVMSVENAEVIGNIYEDNLEIKGDE